MLICRETKSDYMQLTFEKVQRALRVSRCWSSNILLADEQSDRPQNFVGMVQQDGEFPGVQSARSQGI